MLSDVTTAAETMDEIEDHYKVFEDFDWKHEYAEKDVLDLPVEHFGTTIKLRAYRYPPKQYRKGVVFFIHGYGSFAQSNAILAKYFA